MSGSDGGVLHLPRGRLDEAVDALACAFARYPTMAYLFAGAPRPQPVCVRALFRYVALLRFERGWPLLAYQDGGRVWGVACLAEPEVPPPSVTLEAHYEAFSTTVGAQAVARLEAYGALTEDLLPAAPHHYLAALGVHPARAGCGVGGRLLAAVHARAAAAAVTSSGVALSTEDPANVPYYERFGYRTRTQRRLGDLQVWAMFRPHPRR